MLKQKKYWNKAVSEICNAFGSKWIWCKACDCCKCDWGWFDTSFNKDEKQESWLQQLTQSFNTKLANNLDYMKKGADLEIKAFDLNSKMKSMLGKYKSKGLNDRDAYLSNIVDQFRVGWFGKSIKILLLIFKGRLDTYYNSGCSTEILKDYFFFDYFYPTAEPCCEVGNEMYELIKN